jgi:uncharacterized delta-60 repeat protein
MKHNAKLYSAVSRQATNLIVASLSLFVTQIAWAAGRFDPTFGTGGAVSTPIGTTTINSYGQKIRIQADGKLVIAGVCGDRLSSASFDTNRRLCMSRHLSDGTLDSSFGINGVVDTTQAIPNCQIISIESQSDGKVIAVGNCSSLTSPGGKQVYVSRYNTDGSFDVGFNGTGTVYATLPNTEFGTRAVAVQSDGKIVVAGGCDYTKLFCVLRFDGNGSPDTGFGVDGAITTLASGSNSVNARSNLSIAANTANGALLLAGECQTAIGRRFACIARYAANGTLDTNFGGTGVVTLGLDFGASDVYVTAIVTDAVGRLLLLGNCADANGKYRLCIARLRSNGALDSSFGSAGIVVSPVGSEGDEMNSMTLDANGRIVVVGSCTDPASNTIPVLLTSSCIVRFNTDGVRDSSFRINAKGVLITLTLPVGATAVFADALSDVATQPDGKIVTAAYCKLESGRFTFCAARFRGGPYEATACTLNVDGNNVVSAATDALLITRYLLGFRGPALTEGALGANPTRTGVALENYIAGLNLDADGDGQALPVTDGLLLARAMLDVSGTRLTPRANNTASPSVRTAKQIFTWIEATHGVACLP